MPVCDSCGDDYDKAFRFFCWARCARKHGVEGLPDRT
jgi:hypothetical protein